MPSGTLAERHEVLSGGKLCKDRITLLFITNMTVTDKQIHFIGKFNKPRCFKNREIPKDYFANTKAWMTQSIWSTIMTKFNKKMQASGKKNLLFIDNGACHKQDDISLPNIRIVYLPPNTTSLIQPLDQGIIRSFKCPYRTNITRMQLLHLENGMQQDTFCKKIYLDEVIRLSIRAWSTVNPLTIKNCFRTAGFALNTELEFVETDELDMSSFSSATLANEIRRLIDIDCDSGCFVDMKKF